MDNFSIIRALLGGQFPTHWNFLRWLDNHVDCRYYLYNASKSEFRLAQLKDELQEGSLLVGIFKEDTKEFIVDSYYCELIDEENCIVLYDIVLVFRKEENQRVLKKIDSPLEQYKLEQALKKKKLGHTLATEKLNQSEFIRPSDDIDDLEYHFINT